MTVSSTSVQSAMTDISYSIKAGTKFIAMFNLRNCYNSFHTCAGDFTAQILNQEGNSTWPLSHLIYLITYRTNTATDCTVLLDYFQFLSWTQLNDRAVTAATDLDFVPLLNSFRTYCALSTEIPVRSEPLVLSLSSSLV